jgi:hypothetical protein
MAVTIRQLQLFCKKLQPLREISIADTHIQTKENTLEIFDSRRKNTHNAQLEKHKLGEGFGQFTTIN